MGNTILYLTDHWPYPPGESFVSNEIRDLAPHFDKILLLPTTMAVSYTHLTLPTICSV